MQTQPLRLLALRSVFSQQLSAFAAAAKEVTVTKKDWNAVKLPADTVKVQAHTQAGPPTLPPCRAHRGA